MPAGLFHFVIEAGATFERKITWKDENNVVVDTSAYTARMDIRSRKDADTTYLQLTNANGRITLAATAPNITLTVSAADTAALETIAPEWNEGKPAVYDLELVSGTTVFRVLEGVVRLSREVTQA